MTAMQSECPRLVDLLSDAGVDPAECERTVRELIEYTPWPPRLDDRPVIRLCAVLFNCFWRQETRQGSDDATANAKASERAILVLNQM